MSTDEHMKRAQSVAQQITKRVAVALSPLQREMSTMKWPDEFRAIMWEAVANTALEMATEARMKQQSTLATTAAEGEK